MSVQPIESDGEFQINGLRAHTIWRISRRSPQLRDQFRHHRCERDLQVLAERRCRLASDGSEDRGQRSCREAQGVGHRLDHGSFVAIERNHGGSCETAGTRRFAVAHGGEAGDVAGARWIGQFAQTCGRSTLAGEPRRCSSRCRRHPTLRTVQPAAAGSDSPWKFDLREFALREASISAEDRSTSPAVKVLLAPLSAESRRRRVWISPSR